MRRHASAAAKASAAVAVKTGRSPANGGDVPGVQLSASVFDLTQGRVARCDGSHCLQSAVKYCLHEQTSRCTTFQSRVEPSRQWMTEAAQGIFAAADLLLPLRQLVRITLLVPLLAGR